MAKSLGVIGYTDVNSGTRPVDRSAEAQVLGQGLQATKTIIDESIKANVGGDVDDILSAQADAAAVESAVPPEIMWEKGSEEAHIINRIDRLNHVISQGKQSQRTAAEMQIRALQTKAQNKYPWLRDEIARRVNSTVAGSEKMMQIGLSDEARGAAAQAAQGDFDELMKNAHLEWDKGGLGIPMNLTPNDPEFIRLYGERMRMRNTDNEESVMTAMRLVHARQEMNSDSWYSAMDADLTSKYGGIAATLEGIQQDFGYQEILGILKEGSSSANLGKLQQWQATNMPEMQQSIIEARTAIVDAFNTHFTPEMRGTELGKRFEARLNDELSVFDTMLTQMQRFSDDMPGAAQIIETALAVRANALYEVQTNRNKNFMAWSMTSYGKLALEFSGSIANPGGMTLLQDFGVANQSMLAAMDRANFDPGHPNYAANVGAALYNSSGLLSIKPGTSGQDILHVMQGRMADPNNTWTIQALNNQEQTVAALHNANLHTRMWKHAEQTLPNAGPDYANEMLTGVAYSLTFLNMNPTQYKNVQDEVLKSLADESMMNAMNASLKGSDPGRRNAFGIAANQLYLNSQPAQRREQSRRAYQEELVDGVASLSSMVRIKTGALADGIVEYEVGKEEVKPLVNKILSQQFAGGVTISESMRRDAETRAYRMIDQAMAPILGEMKQQIAIEMMLNKARSTTGILNEKDDWTSYFLGQAAPTRGSAWADIFNYTQEGSVSRSN